MTKLHPDQFPKRKFQVSISEDDYWNMSAEAARIKMRINDYTKWLLMNRTYVLKVLKPELISDDSKKGLGAEGKSDLRWVSCPSGKPGWNDSMVPRARFSSFAVSRAWSWFLAKFKAVYK